MAFAQNTRDEVRIIPGDKVCALAAEAGMKQTNYVLTFDAGGNGDGVTVNTMAGDHQNRVTDYTAIVLRNREGKPGGGKGPLLSPERERPLGTANDQVVFVVSTLPGDHCNRVTDYTPVLFGMQRSDSYDNATVASTVASRDYKSATDLVIAPVPAVGRPRRLTPIECERLMGWPDGWTDVPDAKGKPAADSARYKACGNGVASPVAAWIGFRLRDAITAVSR